LRLARLAGKVGGCKRLSVVCFCRTKQAEGWAYGHANQNSNYVMCGGFSFSLGGVSDATINLLAKIEVEKLLQDLKLFLALRKTSVVVSPV